MTYLRYLLLLVVAAATFGQDAGIGPIPPGSTTAGDSNKLEGGTWEAPGPIGSTTPNSVVSTSVTDSGLTSGRVTFASTGGLLADSASLTYNGTVLTAPSITDSALTSGRIPYATTAGLLADSAGLTFNGTTLVVPNATNSSLTATRITYAGTAGLMSDDSGLTRTSLSLVQDANTDATFTTGYGKMGLAASGATTQWYLAQTSCYNSTDYALKQLSGGTTEINSKTGTNVVIGVNNTAKFTVSSSSITAASGVPFTDSDTTNSTSASTGAVISAGGVAGAKNGIFGFGVHQGVASITTAAGTTTLTNASTGVQIFTGSTTQTLQMPAANLYGAGISVQFVVVNRSTGTVTAQRAGSDTFNAAATSFACATLTVTEFWSDGVSAWYTK